MLVYLDTNVWVYAHENHPKFGAPAREVFRALRAGRDRIAASLFVLGELAVLPTRNADRFVIQAYERMFASPEVALLPYSSDCIHTYAELRSTHRLKPLDALHLATAASANVGLFVTEDRQLLNLTVDGIGSIRSLFSM